MFVMVIALTNASLQSAVTKPLEKYLHNMVSKDMHSSGTCC